MSAKLLLACALCTLAAAAGAATLDADGLVLEPSHGYRSLADRSLVNDGSFEQGTCGSGSAWTCLSDNACDWIVDLVPLGLWNYDGNHVGWLGGFCGGLPTCWTRLCQTVFFDSGSLYWWWMAYVNDAIQVINVSVNGNIVYAHALQHGDHLLDYQNTGADVSAYVGGNHELCFWTNNDDCDSNLGDNYFLDFVEMIGGTPVEAASFSTVKTLY